MQPSPLQRSSESGAPSGSTQAPEAEGGSKLSSNSTGGSSKQDTNTSQQITEDSSRNESKKYENEEQMVLDYLKQKGMHNAVAELMKNIASESKESSQKVDEKESESDSPGKKNARERFLEEDEKARAQRTLLTKTTGGGYGYDRDSAWPVVQWGIPDTEAAAISESNASRKSRHLGVEEARGMLDAFIHFQLWVLSFPDHHSTYLVSDDHNYDNVMMQSPNENPILRAQQAILQDEDQPASSIVKTMVLVNNSSTAIDTSDGAGLYNLPPSVKPELLSVSFALLVHTYADLLEVGMESTAQGLRDAFAPVYQALYPTEFKDLIQCSSTESMMRLNAHNSQHIDAVGQLKHILVQVASYQLRKDEYIAHLQNSFGNSPLTPEQQDKVSKDPKVKECEKKIYILQSRYREMSMRATQWFDKMHDLPFLRRARATRWILSLSTSTYAMLAAFLGSRDDSLLAMSTLLQTKCTLQVENREPLSYTPSCITLDGDGEGSSDLDINRDTINWAVPAPRPETRITDDKIPFPKYHMEEEYETEEEAAHDKAVVGFNRALLVNGFRRLEAIERKREYEVLTQSAQKRARQGEIRSRFQANPLEPSILLSTLSASSSLSPVTSKGKRGSDALAGRYTSAGIASTWEEPGIGICCAKICSLGRRVASGCDDAAIRIYSLDNDKVGHEPSQVLVGHKNGFPVFDVNWNRDGRALLSAGGDGSIRLWDTLATGPFGQTTTPKPKTSTSNFEKRTGKKQQAREQTKEVETNVRGWRDGEPVAYTSGAAQAVYRGHAPNAPVWSVSFAPCGYYFCSAGGDATARLWTTDRPVPVRLFSGHVSSNVNCVGWHPNANYVITGSDDKTARLWDIQSGATVRILTGASAGINSVQISPGGRYCAGADYSGLVHLWDLGSGRKISVLRSTPPKPSIREKTVIHSMSFSACGHALSVGGDDCCVRVWDVRKAGTTENEQVRTPFKSFPTRRTVVMDLSYTRRNLLLAVGKYVSHVPLGD